jgi:hypothetical protein
MTFLETWVLTLFLFLFGLPDRVQTAEEVIDRYVSAIGGQAALDSIETMKYTRELNHLEEGKISRRVYYQKRPYYYRSCSEPSTSCLVTNGGEAWLGRSGNGESADEWREIDYPTRETYVLNRMGSFLDYRTRGIHVELIGTEFADGVALNHVRMAWPDGTTRELYFDATTSLLVMFKPDKRTLVRLYDYRRVGNVLIPHESEGRGTHPDGRLWHHINSLVEIELNVPFRKSLFRPMSLDIGS